ncbi:hypothetical protein CASFOL_018405 [Castilleja foliolosa]|uniref:Uncharacterized protein n=1 Tax=Castilleja foliolosa TaxID=1961234 RepID=A0ABD3D8F6_9LAMI
MVMYGPTGTRVKVGTTSRDAVKGVKSGLDNSIVLSSLVIYLVGYL